MGIFFFFFFFAEKNMSSFFECKSYSHFLSKSISVYAIFNDQSCNDTLTKDIISFEQLGPDINHLMKGSVRHRHRV